MGSTSTAAAQEGEAAAAAPSLVRLVAKTQEELVDQLMLAGTSALTLLHFSSEWTEERTSQANIIDEMDVMMERTPSVRRYIKITDARLASRLGIERLPTFCLFRGTIKIDETCGADMSLLRQMIILYDDTSEAGPYCTNVSNSSYPLSTGTYLPIFTQPSLSW